MASTPPTPRPARPPAQTASTSRAAPRPSAKRCRRASSTSSGSTSSPFCSGQASRYSTASPSSISCPTMSSNPHLRRMSATAGRDETMAAYAVAGLGDIGEIGGGLPCRPVRHHFGITSFGINAWTAAVVGDRILNAHDEAGDAEELYLVHRGRATFELDGERVDAPAGTFVFARPGVMRTAFAEEAETTIIAIGRDAGGGLRARWMGAVGAGRAAF